MLYPTGHVRRVAALRSKAIAKLGGVSSGIGFLGAPEWVLGGALAIGLLESMLSSSVHREGVQSLNQAAVESSNIRRSGTFIDVSYIKDREYPEPLYWIGLIDIDVNLQLNEMTQE
jgi:hypothetical protein